MDQRHRLPMLAAALVAALSLAACGERTDTSAPRSDSSYATPSKPTSAPPTTNRGALPSDQVTAEARTGSPIASDASSAARSVESAADKAGTAAGDAAITAKVKTALMATPGIESLKIDVDTANKQVTLTGEVDSAQNRQKAVQVARGVEGVGGVMDRLTVK